MFYYLNGFYWKLISLISFPIMFWYFTGMFTYDYEEVNLYYEVLADVKTNFNSKAISIVILVFYALEVIQFLVLITSRWCSVILLCYYVSKRDKCGFLSSCFERVIQVVCRVSLCTRAALRKPWKRELDQFSLLESCTCFSINNKYLVSFSDVFGVPLPKPGKKQGECVALSEDLKKAVVLSLQTNGPKLSNGVFSLRRNGVEERILWACRLKNDSETIMVWHIATSICEMKNPTFTNEVATKLSKYCAYLLAFAPVLVSIPVLEAEVICETVIKEARALLKKPYSVCGKMEKVNKYDKLMELVRCDEEGGGGESTTILQKGIELGEYLNTIGEGEFILFLAVSDNNELAHVEKLAKEGEFITHLWALLFHAGIIDRSD